MSAPQPESSEGGRTTPDYTDPTIPGAAPDAERPANDTPGPDTGETRPREEADPDRPDVEPDKGNTFEGPGPGA